MAILHHYCSSDTFLSIASTRSIRLSALALSNDSKEGALIKDVILSVAKEENWSSFNLAGLSDAIDFNANFFEGLGFCLSEEPDLLSQWRGYADDGRGLSIGFNSEYLEALSTLRKNGNKSSFLLKQLIYNEQAMREAAHQTLERMKPILSKEHFVRYTDRY